MKPGLALRELRLTGTDVEDAIVTFADGLNVIVGPSDTGKTYIAQCLSFIVGSGKMPKSIPQARPYDTAHVVLVAREDGTQHRLARRLDGAGPVQQSIGEAPVRPLRGKHDPKRVDTLPALLLDLSQLSGRVVRTHAHGKTRPLAFSDVARLFVVDEENVISERSPILGSQNTGKLVARRTFRLVLTGTDDAGVVAVAKPEIARANRAGRTEILEQLAQGVRADLNRLNIEGNIEDTELRAAEWERRAAVAASELDQARRAADPVEERRRIVLSDLRRTRSLSEHRQELQTRFTLLKAQYGSDLDRLALVEQAGGRLEQLTEERCPICGAPAEHQQHEHRRDHFDASNIAESCRAESQKIGILVRDLDATMTANDIELSQLREQGVKLEDALRAAEAELVSVLQPQLGKATRALRESEAGRIRETQAAGLLRQERELVALLADAKATAIPKRADGSIDGVSTAESEALMTAVETLLKSWHFPDLDRVTWSERDEDIVVDGRRRASYGKGKRAIMRSAFNLALLRMLTDEQRPSPGFVLIDSPLVVYREPDAGEEAFPLAVKKHFYEVLAQDFTDAQVLIFENDAPPVSVADHSNITVFTGTEGGRGGFIPRAG
jgi:ssDNA-binding Zn-finger/Zn-ribbon topoisomerase 1